MPISTDEFRAPATLTPSDLGDHLARLVWESFSDFMADGDAEVPVGDLGAESDDGFPPQHTVEEALIFLMWAHTRGAQLAFMGRAPDQLLKDGLDEMHAAIFEDMVHNGTPKSQVPLFEQRVSTRYSEYHAASAASDAELGDSVMGHLASRGSAGGNLGAALVLRARAVANPLRDFLEEIELVPA